LNARALLAELIEAGCEVKADGTALVVRPAARVPEPMRAALREAKADILALLSVAPEALDLSAVAWTDADISAFLYRRARLLRWGWPEAEAESLAEQLVKRGREHDDRVSCTDCTHYRPGFCRDHRRAGLTVADVGRDLAAMLQCCPGFQPAT
jgi:hypothetical protein